MLRATGLVAAVVGAGLTCALGAMARAHGDDTFPTHLAALVALLGAGLALVAVRSPRTPLVRVLVSATGGGLVLYALLGAGACAAAAVGSPAARPLAALWGAAWVPPLVTTSCAALAAPVAAGRPRPRWAWCLLVVGALTTTATALLQEPVDPFAGLPTAAPAAWRGGGTGLTVASLVLAAGVVAVPAAHAVAGVRGRSASSRARSLLLCLAASCPVLVVVVCVLLAAARDPGGVDPSVGSTGFLVVLAAGCAAGCWAVRAAAAQDALPPALAAVRCWAAAAAVLVVLGGGLVAASLLDGAPLLLVVGAVGLLVAAALEGWRRASGWARLLLEEQAVETTSELPAQLPSRPAPAAPQAAPRPAPPPGWSDLTPREREVLAELAAGATNAGIAAALGISPRTVEAHLQSVFTRLDLDGAGGSNRRVVAARLWLEHGAWVPHPVRPATMTR